MITDHYPVVAVAPHPDDLALSAGGLFALLRRYCPEDLQRWKAVTVFTQSVYNPYLSQVAGREQISDFRRKEDQDFFALYGISGHDLGLEDSSCMGVADEDESRVSACDDPRCARVTLRIKEFLDRVSPHLLLIPAGVGSHIDHRLVIAAIQEWRQKTGSSLLLYEDLPYASEFSLAGIDRHLTAEFGPAESWRLDISSAWDEKLRGLACYPSQISALEIAAVRHHAEKLGAGLYHERLWVPVAAASSLVRELLLASGAHPFSASCNSL
jgi:LmbE family N-acetylglucosaminyl deacetylase